MQVFTNIKLLLTLTTLAVLLSLCFTEVYAQEQEGVPTSSNSANNAQDDVKFNYGDTDILIGNEESVPVGQGIDLDLIGTQDLKELPSFNDSVAEQDWQQMPLTLSAEEELADDRNTPKLEEVQPKLLVNKLLDLSKFKDEAARQRAVAHALATHDPYIHKQKILENVVKYKDNISIDSLTDNDLKERLDLLPTVIKMDYNPLVRKFIDLYINNKEEQLKRMLRKSSLYFPIFEEVLSRYGMPIELKYLPVVQTALIPHAQSNTGATGLWLLNHSVAYTSGLAINTFVDERRDPKLSTEAAVKQLRRQYFRYQDWHLAIAAFVAGEGAVEKAIRRAGFVPNSPDKDYWKIESFLPKEARVYVPLFIAANYVMNYYPKHGIKEVDVPYTLYTTDTVHVKREVKLQDASAFINMPLNEIRFLNPALLKDVIPATKEGFGYPVVLPSFKIGLFEVYLRNLSAAEIDIVYEKKPIEMPLDNPLNYEMDDFNVVLTASKEYSDNRTAIVNSAKAAHIAARAADAIAAASKAQKLTEEAKKAQESGNLLEAESAAKRAKFAAQKAINIQKALEESETKIVVEAPKTAVINIETDKIDYTVQPDENIKDIAKRYNCKAEDIVRWNKLTSEMVEEGMGLRLFLLPDLDDELIRNYILNTSGKQLSNKKYLKPEAPEVETELSKKIVKGEETYVVRPGEKLHDIAKKYNMTSTKIMNYNNLINSNLHTNQVLKIPVFEDR